MKTTCLNCRFYKIQDVESGLCREEALTSKNHDAEKPVVKASHCCDQWVDCGQTYYIRLGWIKKNSENGEKEEQAQ